jgi:dihydrolipoamide dehydrogenase
MQPVDGATDLPDDTPNMVDVIVIGAGAAGEVAAGRLGRAGLSVVIVEDHLVGGECSYYACVPSKALLRPGEVLAEAQGLPGVDAGPQLDSEAVLAWRDRLIAGLDDAGQLPWLSERGVHLIRGRARLVAERAVAVGDRVLTARTAVILASGSRPFIPPIPGLRHSDPWTTREATTASTIPERLLVLGGGLAGVELAQAFSRLGSSVTIAQRGDRLLTQEEPFASELLRKAFETEGITVYTGCAVQRAWRDETGVHMQLQDGRELRGDELLVTTGRMPVTRMLGLQAFGLSEEGPVAVDDRMQVLGHSWLYAVGDLNGRSLYTHMGKHQARIAADVILGYDAAGRPLANDAQAPRVIFTDPQIASVGHTTASAAAAGLEVTVSDVPSNATAGGRYVGHGDPGTTRFVAAPTDRRSGRAARELRRREAPEGVRRGGGFCGT